MDLVKESTPTDPQPRLHARGRPILRQHRRAFYIGMALTVVNLVLMIGLLFSWLSDTYFLVLAGTAPWSVALFGIGLIPPKEIHDIKWAE